MCVGVGASVCVSDWAFLCLFMLVFELVLGVLCVCVSVCGPVSAWMLLSMSACGLWGRLWLACSVVSACACGRPSCPAIAWCLCCAIWLHETNKNLSPVCMCLLLRHALRVFMFL